MLPTKMGEHRALKEEARTPGGTSVWSLRNPEGEETSSAGIGVSKLLKSISFSGTKVGEMGSTFLTTFLLLGVELGLGAGRVPSATIALSFSSDHTQTP